MTLSRRSLIKDSALSLGGWLMSAEFFPEILGGLDSAPANPINSWLEWSPEGRLCFLMGAQEMGQSSLTGLAIALCEELDYPLEQLDYRFPLADDCYKHPEFKLQLTGGSSSIRSFFTPIRQIGAEARSLFIQAAAQKDGQKPKLYRTQNAVVLGPRGQTHTYASLMPYLKNLKPLEVVLKDPKDFRLIGKAHTRLDARAKCEGKAVFGIDVDWPGAWVATLIYPPIWGDRALSFDDSMLTKEPGYRGAFILPQGVAVVARHFGLCLRAVEELKINWAGEGEKAFSTSFYLSQLRQSLDQESWGGSLQASYSVPFLAHAPLEPLNAAAHYDPRRGHLKIFCSTQAPSLVKNRAAEMTGLSEEQIEVANPFIGGGFGRRLEVDFVDPAIRLALALEEPVRLIYTREHDLKSGYYRPAAALKFSALLNQEGKVTKLKARLATQSLSARVISSFANAMMPKWIPPYFKNQIGAVAGMVSGGMLETEGLKDWPYTLESYDFDHIEKECPLSVTSFRSVGHSMNAFFVESFTDEIATKLSQDPLQYRIKNCQGKHKDRMQQLLLKLKELCAYEYFLSKELIGFAAYESFFSLAAMAISLTPTDQGFKVAKVCTVLDCGLAVHPEGVKTQMEGSIIFALSAALYGELKFEGGMLEQKNFDTYPLITFDQVPELECHIMDSGAPMGGVGEPIVPLVAPALANAYFKASGKRLRDLPLKLS